MDTILTSIYGISDDPAEPVKRSEVLYALFGPLLKTSYWQQRSKERGFHGVFYHFRARSEGWVISLIPFWSSMTSLQREEVQRYLGRIDLTADLLTLAYFGPVFESRLGKVERTTTFFTFSRGWMAYGLDFSGGEVKHDKTIIYKAMIEGYKIIGQDLENFFAHFPPHAYDCM